MRKKNTPLPELQVLNKQFLAALDEIFTATSRLSRARGTPGFEEKKVRLIDSFSKTETIADKIKRFHSERVDAWEMKRSDLTRRREFFERIET